MRLPSAEGRVVSLHLSYGKRKTLCPKTVTKGCSVDSDFLRAWPIYIWRECLTNGATNSGEMTLVTKDWRKRRRGGTKNIFPCCLSACMYLCSLCSSDIPHWLMLLRLWHLAHLNKWIWAKDKGHWQMCRQALGLVSGTKINKASLLVHNLLGTVLGTSDSHDIIKIL